MTTFPFIDEQPISQALFAITAQEELDRLVAAYKTLVPEWLGVESDPLYKMFATEAAFRVSRNDRYNSGYRGFYASSMIGSQVDDFGANFDIPRNVGEGDDAYVRRILTTFATSFSTTLPGIRANCIIADSDVTDVVLQANANGSVDIACAYELSVPTLVQRAAISAYVTGRTRRDVDDRLSIVAVTETQSEFAARVYYDTRNTAFATVSAQVTQAVEAWRKRNFRFGVTVWKTNLEAALKTADATRASVSSFKEVGSAEADSLVPVWNELFQFADANRTILYTDEAP